MNTNFKISELMEAVAPRLPVMTFDPVSEKLLLTPTGTLENNYKPTPIDVSRRAFVLDRNKIDYGYRAFATGGVREVVARWPAAMPTKPTETLSNSKGPAAWGLFIRAFIMIDGHGKAAWEIDRNTGAQAVMQSFEDVMSLEAPELVIVMHQVIDTAGGPKPLFRLATDADAASDQ